MSMRTHRQSPQRRGRDLFTSLKLPRARMHPHQSCRLKSLDVARSILVILVLLIRCAGFYFALRNELIKIVLVEDYQVIYDASHCDH